MKIQRVIAVTALTIAMLTLTAPAQAQLPRGEGAAEQLGEVVGGVLDQTGRAIERGFRSAFARTRGLVESMEVTSRVYSRLHWDKALAGARLYLEVRPGGVVILQGTVPTEENAERAVTLAAETIGVTRVVSELDVLAPSLEKPETTVVPDPVPSVEPEPIPPAELEPLPPPLPRP